MPDEYETADSNLKFLILRLLPNNNSFGAARRIMDNNGDNDVGKLIMRRALLNIDRAAEEYFKKTTFNIPCAFDTYEAVRITKLYDNIYIFNSTSNKRCLDLDFQVHKHATIQHVLVNTCRLASEESPALNTVAVCDGIQPSDYGFIFKVEPMIRALNDPCITDEQPEFIIVNLFDSSECVEQLIYKLALKRNVGSELTIIVPYDYTMWTCYCGNVFNGAYSFEWTHPTTRLRKECYIRADKLPLTFFNSKLDAQFVLNIRPFHSNKILRIPILDFLRIHASGDDEGLFKETRRISHGFAEVNIIGFRPVHLDPISKMYNIKRMNLPYGKRIITQEIATVITHEFGFGFAKALQSPSEYIIDESVFNRTKKAAMLVRLSRNCIIPIIYHLFAYSTHVVHNGSIVTLQKVMNPELICQITEVILLEVIQIKLNLLQKCSIIRAGNDLTLSSLFRLSLEQIALSLIDKLQSVDDLSIRNLTKILHDPSMYKSLISGEKYTGTLSSCGEGNLD